MTLTNDDQLLIDDARADVERTALLLERSDIEAGNPVAWCLMS